jgi:hypothetical protein
MSIISHVPPLSAWNVSQIIFDITFLVVNVCVFDQSCGHWLLFDALCATITMTLKPKK